MVNVRCILMDVYRFCSLYVWWYVESDDYEVWFSIIMYVIRRVYIVYSWFCFILW